MTETTKNAGAENEWYEEENEYFSPLEANDETRAKQLEDAVQLKRSMKELLENKAFKVMQEKLDEQVELRIRSMLVMPEGADDVVKRTYSCGEIAGMKIARDFAQIQLDGAQGTIEFLQAQVATKEEENG